MTIRVIAFLVLIVTFVTGAIQSMSGHDLAGPIMLASVIAYLILSFGTVSGNEVAARLTLGKVTGNIEPGPYFALWLIERVWKESANVFQDELPGPPEKIFRNDDTAPVPEGMFPPNRVKFGQPNLADTHLTDDAYNIAMVAEVPLVVEWSIVDASVFYATVGDVENARKMMNDKGIAVFNDEFSKITPAKALENLFDTSKRIEKILKRQMKASGIRIRDAYAKPFIFSHDLNKAVTGVSTARENKRATGLNAEAERDKRIKEGEGTARARQLLLEAEAIGATKLAELTKTPEGQIALYIETMSKALQGSSYSIVPGGDFFGAFAGMQQLMDNVKTAKEKK